MSMLALFEIETDWRPIFQPPYVETANLTKEQAKASWKAYAAEFFRCRDCGTPSKLNSGGSGDGRGTFWLCDDCAVLDCATIREHLAAPCEPRAQVWGWTFIVADCPSCGWEQWSDRLVGHGAGTKESVPQDEIEAATELHNRARYGSRWGKLHEISEHEHLLEAREARRRKSHTSEPTGSGTKEGKSE